MICDMCGMLEAFEWAGQLPAWDGHVYWEEADDDAA